MIEMSPSTVDSVSLCQRNWLPMDACVSRIEVRILKHVDAASAADGDREGDVASGTKAAAAAADPRSSLRRSPASLPLMLLCLSRGSLSLSLFADRLSVMRWLMLARIGVSITNSSEDGRRREAQASAAVGVASRESASRFDRMRDFKTNDQRNRRSERSRSSMRVSLDWRLLSLTQQRISCS